MRVGVRPGRKQVAKRPLQLGSVHNVEDGAVGSWACLVEPKVALSLPCEGCL
jgi:hypothetical protein